MQSSPQPIFIIPNCNESKKQQYEGHYYAHYANRQRKIIQLWSGDALCSHKEEIDLDIYRKKRRSDIFPSSSEHVIRAAGWAVTGGDSQRHNLEFSGTHQDLQGTNSAKEESLAFLNNVSIKYIFKNTVRLSITQASIQAKTFTKQ